MKMKTTILHIGLHSMKEALSAPINLRMLALFRNIVLYFVYLLVVRFILIAFFIIFSTKAYHEDLRSDICGQDHRLGC